MLWPTSSDNSFTISPARSAIELTSAAALFRAYAKALPVDLAPQGFAAELKSLPGPYAPPAGELLLAKRGDHVLGCVGLKALAPPDVAEIKLDTLAEMTPAIALYESFGFAPIPPYGSHP